jgi:hypothetical protein
MSCADEPPISGDRETPLLAGLDHAQKIFTAEVLACGVSLDNQLVNRSPALWVERQPDGIWLVPKDET